MIVPAEVARDVWFVGVCGEVCERVEYTSGGNVLRVLCVRLWEHRRGICLRSSEGIL